MGRTLPAQWHSIELYRQYAAVSAELRTRDTGGKKAFILNGTEHRLEDLHLNTLFAYFIYSY